MNRLDKYLVADIYDNWLDMLGKTSDMREVKKWTRERIKETDGECLVVIYKRQENGKFNKNIFEVVKL